MSVRELAIVPIGEVPLVKPGDHLPSILVECIRTSNTKLHPGDILIVTHTIVSISEDRLIPLSDVRASEEAKRIAASTGRDSAYIQVALDEAIEIIRDSPVLITRTRIGIITDFSGVDQSNAPIGHVIVMPKDPDASAGAIRTEISKEFGFEIPVIVADTQGRPWRKGAVNLAIGVAGMSPFIENKGKEDRFGRELMSSKVCLADQLAAAAELVMGQANEGIPAVIVRGLQLETQHGSAKQIVRGSDSSLFK